MANDSARARPNRCMGGPPWPVARPGPLTPSEVHDFMPPTPRDHVGQKGVHTCTTESRGWGGRRILYPRPRQVKSCHVTPPIIAYVRGCPSKILTKQSKHMYLLTRLSASQTATWHVYFRMHQKYKFMLNCQRVARGAAVEERKEPQHVARRTL